jgi:hypothetical protein
MKYYFRGKKVAILRLIDPLFSWGSYRQEVMVQPQQIRENQYQYALACPLSHTAKFSRKQIDMCRIKSLNKES